MKEKETYLVTQDREIERVFNHFHRESIRLERLQEDLRRLADEKQTSLNELSVIRANIDMARNEYEKVATKVSDIKGKKNKLVAESFVKEVKDVYYLRRDNDELRKKLEEVTENIASKRASNE